MQQTLRHTGVNLCPSIDYRAGLQEAQAANRPAAPVRRGRAPSAIIDSSLTDDGTWVMTMFPNTGRPTRRAGQRGAREKYADAASSTWRNSGPTSPTRSSKREILAPPDIERIFGLTAARSSGEAKAWTRWRSCAPPPTWPATATPWPGSTSVAPGPTRGGGVVAEQLQVDDPAKRSVMRIAPLSGRVSELLRHSRRPPGGPGATEVEPGPLAWRSRPVGRGA